VILEGDSRFCGKRRENLSEKRRKEDKVFQSAGM